MLAQAFPRPPPYRGVETREKGNTLARARALKEIERVKVLRTSRDLPSEGTAQSDSLPYVLEVVVRAEPIPQSFGRREALREAKPGPAASRTSSARVPARAVLRSFTGTHAARRHPTPLRAIQEG